MLHTKEFSLYESMSAIELMDHKMDLKMNLKEAITLDKAL